MPQGSQTVPELFNPYIGKSYGNILDQYSSSTYNIKLYMINAKGQAGEASESSDTARQDTGTAGNSNSVLTAAPQETVILAQTGVTAGNTIESLTIPTLADTTLAGITMVIKQPNRADFLDQIVLARSFLNLEKNDDLTFYIEVSFLGYEAEDDLYQSLGGGTDTGGELVEIIGPYRWKVVLAGIEASMDATGATYTCLFNPKGREAFINRRFRTGSNITAKGRTITEMVKSVEDALNKFNQENNDKLVKDEIEFDLSGLIASDSNTSDQNKVLIEDENLILPDASTGDTTTAPLNQSAASGEKTAEERIGETQDPDANPSELGEEEITNVINFNTGESIQDIMNKILAMCPEARYRHTRKENPDEIDDQACRKDQAFVQTLKINASLEDLGFDPRTNMAVYKVIYRPVLYRTASDTQFLVVEENNDLKPDDVQSRIQQLIDSGNIRKAYQYLFTGQNDQIKSLDINYNALAVLNATPRRGLVGTTDSATSKEKTETVDKDEDTSVGGLLDNLLSGFEALAKDTVSSLFSGDFSGLQGGLDSLVSSLAGQGFSNTQLAELQQAIQSGAQAEINQFLETIDSATLRNLATNLIINPENVTSGSPPNYSPEQSGYQYSEDFFALNSTTGIDINDLSSLGFLSNIDNPGGRSQLFTYQVDTDTPQVNPVEGVTVDHRRPQANSLFGQLLNQQAARTFLQNLNMTIRGDPWYLGYDTSQGQNNNSQAGQSSADSFESSQPEYAYFDGDDNYLFLEIAAPRPWDFDYRDEDSALNSGYWMNTNTSYAFTGVYRLQHITHTFAGGVYETEISGVRIEAIKPEDLEKKQP